MERLMLKYKDALKALDTLEEILRQPFSIIVRDATIQRFEYTFEALWKFLKEYLKEREGIVSNSPKSCFRETFSLGFITEEETVKFLEMTDRRNDTSHTYKEEVAQIIYSKIPEYFSEMKGLLKKFQEILA
ncbi:MAG: nucleotidyltransferase substrate binding protein [Planctomycetes bacterium]|uniref:HI0074 family nucleotidyltransferase substrate-binding subunit n=1 Tax=Candidatus Wunengus sp. YC65 TaxID=3367701 RepID=UPI001D705300|nr:nucleotidyltransferase substrate binding protein [Planctomycetota bacterium]